MHKQLAIKYRSTISSNCQCLQREKRFCDFLIRVGKHEIPVHRVVLAAASDYFNIMLSSGTKESQDGYVDIKQVDPYSVIKCVEYMYSGKLPENLEQPAGLIHPAIMFHLHELSAHVIMSMIKGLDYSNLFHYRQVARLYAHESLLQACDNLAIEKFHEYANSDSFRKIDADFIEFLMATKGLKIFDNVKCKVIMAWVRQEKEREVRIFDLIRHIDITNVDHSYRKYLLNQPAIMKSMECVKYISSSMPTIFSVEAVQYSGNCSLGMLAMRKHTLELERFDLMSRSWIKMHSQKPPSYRKECFMISVDNYLYVLDGFSLYSIKLTNSKTRWKKLSPPFGPCGGPIAAFDGMLYVLNTLGTCQNLQMYDISCDCWYKLPQIRKQTDKACMCIARNMVLLVSGIDVEWLDYFRGVQCFNLLTLKWCLKVGKLNVGRSHAAACTHNDAVYVFGGEGLMGVCNSFEILRSESSDWEVVELEGLNLKTFNCHSVAGMIYIVGYKSEAYDHQTLVIFDAKTKSIASKLTIVDSSSHHPYRSSAMVIM